MYAHRCECMDTGVNVWTQVCLYGHRCECMDTGVNVWTQV